MTFWYSLWDWHDVILTFPCGNENPSIIIHYLIIHVYINMITGIEESLYCDQMSNMIIIVSLFSVYRTHQEILMIGHYYNIVLCL